MAYATLMDLQARMTRQMANDEQLRAAVLLDDIGVLIDSVNAAASAAAKKTVSCSVAIRVLGSGETESAFPLGSAQGTVSALGYSQSWTMPSGGASGEMYLTKTEKRLLGVGNSIGAWSPVQGLVPDTEVSTT